MVCARVRVCAYGYRKVMTRQFFPQWVVYCEGLWAEEREGEGKGEEGKGGEGEGGGRERERGGRGGKGEGGEGKGEGGEGKGRDGRRCYI